MIWIVVAALCAAVGIALAMRLHAWHTRLMTIQGAVIRRDDDSRKELPIADAVVTASHGSMRSVTQSDASGYFKMTLPEEVWPGQVVVLSFTHPDYQQLDSQMKVPLRSAAKKLVVAAMIPVPSQDGLSSGASTSVVSNIRVRYSVNSMSEQNIGSAVRVFQVVNQGNVQCKYPDACSPDGSWKAASGSTSLDAGDGNEFRNVRSSCIAGPCPFTRIDSSGFVSGGRTITVSAVDWSDTATFLVEAEVFRKAIASNVRRSYPVIFGRTINFTLPPVQEGVTIEADVDGSPMVFPLGPDLFLSWATCTTRTSDEAEKSTVYRCELKPGYRF